MNAGHAGRLVARFIDKSYPQDIEDINQILRLGINKAWQEGKWLGMTSEFFVPVFKDRNNQSYFMAPQSHPILLAVNYAMRPRDIRSPYFMFHRNGMGDVKNSHGCNWNEDVYDLGGTPYYDRNNINFSDGVMIGVRSLGPAGSGEKIIINGAREDGKKIFTYTNSSVYGEPCACSIDTADDEINTVNGVVVDVLPNKFNYICNVTFGSITAISKTITKSQVEIIAVDKAGNAYPIALLEPYQRYSKYRKYLVPDSLCDSKCIHGIFKIAQQEQISSETDELVIHNEEAIICFAKSVYNSLYKEQIELGAAYLVQGISILEKEKREEDSPESFPVQVHGISYADLPQIMTHYS